ncbi:hypothetical protein RF11_02903 [Thelohanellus kitauei]|uniref:Uncharacterized protein n=1 Tax=Thelohanellus kitauei TaxID=669202 RepID=A0A0C2MVH8_THEKT|nr:hypothetical protein RF11_02903 [Thelohanellus kitauei]
MDTNMEMNSNDSVLIEILKNHPAFNQWTSNRLLMRVLQCYLQNNNLDQFFNPHKRGSVAKVASQKSAPFMIFVGSVVVTMLIVGMINYKRGILERNQEIRIQANEVYYEIQDNLIADV